MNDQTELRNQQLAEMQAELDKHAERLGIAKSGLEKLENAETIGEMKQAAEATVHALGAESVELDLAEKVDEEIGDKIADIMHQAIPVDTMVKANRKERRRKKSMIRRAKKQNRGFTKSAAKTRNRKKR